MSTRLNKFLADRGVASRRASDRLIEEGRVRINGRVVSDLGTKVEEQRDRVSVDGKPIGGRERHVYFVLNKPVGVITTLNDPEGRRTVRDMLPRGARVYPVGRLDADTSGLLLLTNDGDLAHKLMHPRYGVAKVYRVRLAREPRPDQMRRLSTGVRFDKGLVSGRARARRIDPGFDAIMIELVVHEGRFRQVRKMCEAVGLEVTGLHRVGYGPIRLGPLARGMFRELSDEEVTKLRAESARAGRSAPDGEAARPKSSERPRRAVVEAADDGDDGDDGLEETWVSGGGFLEPEPEEEREEPPRRAERAPRSEKERPSEWPARAGDRRGDDDWRPASGPARRPGGERRGGPGGERPGSPRSERQGSPRGEFRGRPRSERPGSPRGEFRGTTRRERPGGPRSERRSGPGGERRGSPRGEFRGSTRRERPGGPRGERRSGPGGERRGSPRGESRGNSRGARPGRPRQERAGRGRVAESRASGRNRRSSPRNPSRRKPR